MEMEEGEGVREARVGVPFPDAVRGAENEAFRGVEDTEEDGLRETWEGEKFEESDVCAVGDMVKVGERLATEGDGGEELEASPVSLA